MALLFSRNAKVYVELEAGGASPLLDHVWEVPVLDGFSFSQSSESAEIVASEAGGTASRGRLLFNTAINPVEWSFSTYVRPFKTAGNGLSGAYSGTLNQIHAVEEVLWAMLFGGDTFATATGRYSKSPSTNFHTLGTTTGSKFDLNAANLGSFSDNWNLYFSFEEGGSATKVYKLNQAVVNSATIDFDIEGIATIQWSGFAKNIEDKGTSKPTKDYYEKVADTGTFIRNKLSTLSLQDKTLTSPQPSYTINITGGSINFENNITYLTPEELGIVNQPFANIAGTRSISGNLTCYLDTDTGKSQALYSNLVGATTTVRNKFEMALNIGGTSGNTLKLALPTAHLEIPNIGIEDLITLDVTFHAQPSTNSFTATDEASITYNVT